MPPGFLDPETLDFLRRGGSSSPRPPVSESFLDPDTLAELGGTPRQQPAWYDTAALTALRTIPAIAGQWIGGGAGAAGGSVVPGAGTAAGGIGGSIAGGAIGAGVGELGAQTYEAFRGLDDDFNLLQVGAQAGIGAIPFAEPFKKVAGYGGTALRALANATQGGIIGGAATPITTAIERRALPSAGEAIDQAKTGAAFGAAFGGLLSPALEFAGNRMARRATRQQSAVDAQFDPNFDERLADLMGGGVDVEAPPPPPPSAEAQAFTSKAPDGGAVLDQDVIAALGSTPAAAPPSAAIPPVLAEAPRRYDLFEGIPDDDPLRALAEAAGVTDAGGPAAVPANIGPRQDQGVALESPAGLGPDAGAPGGNEGGPVRARLDEPLADPFLEARLDELFADAAEQGFDGSLPELRAIFADRVAEAERAAAELADARSSGGADPGDLLRDVARLGGLGDDAGYPGELAWLREARDMARGSQAGGRRGRPLFGQVQGVRNVFRREGRTLDGMLEALNEEYRQRHPEAVQRFETINDLLDALGDAVRQPGRQTQPNVMAALEGLLDVRPGARWWEDPAVLALGDANLPENFGGGDVSFNPAEFDDADAELRRILLQPEGQAEARPVTAEPAPAVERPPARAIADQDLEAFIADNPPILGRMGGTNVDYEGFRGGELGYAGEGAPGLSIEPGRDLGDFERVIAYRDRDGQPLAMARVVRDPDGNWTVYSIAGAKDRGLAAGRAVNTVLQEVEKLNPVGVIGGLSDDAQNMLRKYAARRGRGRTAESPNPLPETVDVNEFGEAQPRLPGAENVREQNVQTPELADVPFTLEGGTSDINAPREQELLTRFLDDEAGFATTPAAIRVAGGAGGAAYGYATGEDDRDRLTRAAVYGGLGLAGATALTRGMGTRARPADTPGGAAAARPTAESAPATPPGPPAAPPAQPTQRAGRRLPKYAHNINLERIDSTDQVKGVINETARAMRGQFDAAKRGVIRQEVTRQMAAELGMTPQQLLQRRRGEAFNAEEALAAREINVSSAERVWNLASRVRDLPANSPERAQAMAELLAGINQHVAIQEQITGMTAEAGRALSQFRMMAEARGNLGALNDLISLEGGQRRLDEIATRLLSIDPTNVRAINQFTREARKATTADKVYEAWVNALLSGPVTHVANAVSNGLTAGTMPIEKGIAAALDAVRSLGTGKPRERFFAEASDAFFGLWKGIAPGVRAGLQAFMTETPQFGRVRADVSTAGERAIGGAVGRAVRIPSRVLAASDEFFKAVLYSADLHSRALRQALSEGRAGQAVGERVAEIIANPSRELVAKSQREALYRTFNTPLSGEAESSLFKLRRAVPGAKWIVPFLRTPVNIAKFGLERTPLSVGQVLTKWRDGQLKGGELSDEAAKTVLGTLVAMGVAGAFKNGMITGGGSPDRATHSTQLAARPDYSLKVGNQWVSYQRTEPLGMTVGLVADFMELLDLGGRADVEGKDLIAKAVGAFSRNIQSKTFLQGVTDFFNVLSDPDQYGDRWVQRMAGSVVPTAVAQTARTVDPVRRKTRSIGDTIASRIPGQSDSLPPAVDVFGRPIVSEETAPERLISPFRRREVQDDPLVNELLRLGLPLGLPSDRLELPGDTRLGSADASTLQQARGQVARRQAERVINSPLYGRLSDEQKRLRLKQAIEAGRDTVSSRARSRARRGDTLTLESILGMTP